MGQDPLEIRGCFLILSFLCWPALAARRGRGSSGQDQGEQEVQIMMTSVELPLTGAYDIQTPYKAICGAYLIEASTLHCEEGHCPHFTEVETEVQGGQNDRRPHNPYMAEPAGNPVC